MFRNVLERFDEFTANVGKLLGVIVQCEPHSLLQAFVQLLLLVVECCGPALADRFECFLPQLGLPLNEAFGSR